MAGITAVTIGNLDTPTRRFGSDDRRASVEQASRQDQDVFVGGMPISKTQALQHYGRPDMRAADHKRIANPLRALTLMFLCGVCAPLQAQTAATSRREAKPLIPPLPQPRPNNLPTAPPAIAVPPQQATSNPPPANPIEMRARLRNCAMQWKGMKEHGEDLGKTWGDFSQDCLAKN